MYGFIYSLQMLKYNLEAKCQVFSSLKMWTLSYAIEAHSLVCVLYSSNV